jgi:hypothetical protein
VKYNTEVVLKMFEDYGIPAEAEYKFYKDRNWRFDFAWPEEKLALEVQGGLFSYGRHSRGAALMKEHEKLNYAASVGWRILYTIPSEVCMEDTIDLIKSAFKTKSC